MAKENLKQGYVVIPDAAKRLRRELNGEVVTDFYGEHHFKKGQTAIWNENGEWGFFSINGISAEKLVQKGVCSKDIDKENEAVKYEIIKDCTIKISHGGTEKFARKGVEEVRNITLYEIV